MTNQPRSSRFRFSVFDLDMRTGELRKGGARVRLQGQPLQILAALLERPGEVVTRQELRQRLWPENTFVEFDHSLNAAVKRLREALGDAASTPRFVETLPKRGYRLIVPVEHVETGGSDALDSTPISGVSTTKIDAPRLRRRQPVLVVGGIAAALIIAATAAILLREPESPAPESSATLIRLAVLPFANLTGDATKEYVSEGLTEELVAQLGRLAPGRLGVIARSSTTSFGDTPPPLREIAESLGADYLIEGSVRSMGDRYRIAVRLVSARDVTSVWSELYDGAVLDLVRVQRDVSQQVARHLALALLPDDQTALARATTTSSRAFDAYLRGLHELERGPQRGFDRSAQLFREAIEHDPRYALAHAGLSEVYVRQRDYLLEPEQALERARAAALEALALDDNLAEAHCALADVLSRSGNASGAEREFRRALALNPSHATTYHRYAWHLVHLGRQREARALIERASVLAPRSAEMATASAYIDLLSGHVATTAAMARQALEYQPGSPFAHYLLGRVAIRRRAHREAIAEFDRARVSSGGAPKYIAALGSAYLAAGRTGDARRMLDKLRRQARIRYVAPGMISGLAEGIRTQETSVSRSAESTGTIDDF